MMKEKNEEKKLIFLFCPLLPFPFSSTFFSACTPSLPSVSFSSSSFPPPSPSSFPLLFLSSPLSLLWLSPLSHLFFSHPLLYIIHLFVVLLVVLSIIPQLMIAILVIRKRWVGGGTVGRGKACRGRRGEIEWEGGGGGGGRGEEDDKEEKGEQKRRRRRKEKRTTRRRRGKTCRKWRRTKRMRKYRSGWEG